MEKSTHVIALFALTLASLANAQRVRQQDPARQQAALEGQQQFVGNVSPDATTTCTYTFTSGTGNTFLKYCVTKNGNIVQFESPSGQEYIAVGTIGEGYAFCDFDSSTQYFDYAGYGDSGNWQAPVTQKSTASSVKISRETTDGMYTLVQTISQNPGSALAQVTMEMKNNTSSSHHIGLLRYADVDASGDADNSFDYTYRTAFGYNETGYGLQLTYVSGQVSGGPSFNGAFAQIIAGGPNPCQIFTHVAGPLQDTDGSIFAQYDMELAAKKAATVVVDYKAF